MINIVVITSVRRGTASLCLPTLAKNGEIRVLSVIYARNNGVPLKRLFVRRIKKIIKIGLLGALNGIRIRPWFRSQQQDIEEVCKLFNVPYHEVPSLNGQETVNLLNELQPDLGVSLGNGYITSRVFERPRYGMINVHSEILPAYQNAQSIIWPIYFNDKNSGFTIHEISCKIDAGKILLQKQYSLKFFRDLETTVRWNKQKIELDIPTAVAEVCANIRTVKQHAVAQGIGGIYTTPTIWQFLKIVINNKRMFLEQGLKNAER